MPVRTTPATLPALGLTAAGSALLGLGLGTGSAAILVLAACFAIAATAAIVTATEAELDDPDAGSLPVTNRRGLERHLAWFRRREERGDIAVVRVPAGIDAEEARRAFRITDSVAIRAAGGRAEIELVVDRVNLDREALERRVADRLGTDELKFGWAMFPEQGLTLSSLLSHARAALPATGLPARGTPATHPAAHAWIGHHSFEPGAPG